VSILEILKSALLFLHFVGLASLLGGFLTQLSAEQKRVVPAMLHGALTQLVTGVLLVGVDEALDDEVIQAKIGVKLLVVVAILALLWVNRARPALSKGVFFAIGGLTALNIAIAVFWT
jgi:hypothetical protein